MSCAHTSMTKLRDLTGQRFGRLRVLRCLGPYKATPSSEPKVMWRCICDCGNERKVVRGSLVSGLTQSCGCLNRESAKRRHTTHGGTGEVLYSTWRKMIERCYDKKCPGFKYYGGRGIKICKEWRKDFRAFANHMGKKPSPQHSIDRYPNNDGDYEPGNVRWATREQQAKNRRRQARKTHCKRGHTFTKENTYWVIRKDGGQHQSCKTCRRMSELKRQRGERARAQ